MDRERMAYAEEYLIPRCWESDDSARECPALFAKVRAHRMAKAALENAVWDAEASTESRFLCGSCSAARGARSPAASLSAFRIQSSNCWKKSD